VGLTDTVKDSASIDFIHRSDRRCEAHHPTGVTQELSMLHYAVVFLVVALIAAVLGFGGIAASAAGIAKILFVVFLVMAVVSFLFGWLKR
jgi:uncharacterized membrane protein YtjA (UPF0391 family)